MNAPIRYARSGEVNIAYQVTGDGPFDLVLVPGFFSHLELDWELPAYAHFLERLGSFARLIRFDKRGTGLSDRGVGLPDFETRMDDVRAVMDAAGSDVGGAFRLLRGRPDVRALRDDVPGADTAARPLRHVRQALSIPTADYPWAPTAEERVRDATELERTWGENVDVSDDGAERRRSA